MKRLIIEIYVCVAITVIAIIGITSSIWYYILIKERSNKKVEYVCIKTKEMVNMVILAKAIAIIESEDNSNSIGDGGNAIGNLQIWKIYVDEVNRLEGYKKYKYDDRYDKDKSISMFIDMNKHKNPNDYLHLAIKIHNPKASLSYHRRIEDKYNELIEQKSKKNCTVE